LLFDGKDLVSLIGNVGWKIGFTSWKNFTTNLYYFLLTSQIAVEKEFGDSLKVFEMNTNWLFWGH